MEKLIALHQACGTMSIKMARIQLTVYRRGATNQRTLA
jgi:hypothetical protein